MIYAVQDTTTINYSSLKAITGLGPINGSPHARGALLPTTLALREDGTPLGPLDQQYWSRPAGKKTAKERRRRPFEEKESYKWFRGVVAARRAIRNNLDEPQRPRLIHVMDRKGDIHEVLEMISASDDGAVIRCVQNRKVAGEISKAHDAVGQQPPLGQTTITAPRKGNQPQREATLGLRAARLTVMPADRKRSECHPCEATLLEAIEVDAPTGVAPLRWLLWSTEPVTTVDQAVHLLTIYTYRWRVEDFHFVLKSGCRIEELELHTAEQLFKAVALYSAVAARVVMLRDLGRRDPDAPCTCVLTQIEWQALSAHFSKRPGARGHQQPPTLKQAILWIGRLGGHMGRKSDGMPGVKTLWRGIRDLSLLVAGYGAAG